MQGTRSLEYIYTKFPQLALQIQRYLNVFNVHLNAATVVVLLFRQDTLKLTSVTTYRCDTCEDDNMMTLLESVMQDIASRKVVN